MKVLFLCITWMTWDFCYGQTSLSLGANTGIVTNLHSLTAGLGGSAELMHRFSEQVGSRLYAGYDYFKARGPHGYVAFLPLRPGVEGILSDIFFLFGDAGIARYRSPLEKETHFSFDLGGGYKVPFGLHKQFVQISAFYNSLHFGKNYWLNWITLRVAYGFDLGKASKTRVDKV